MLRTLPIGVSAYAWDEARISYDALRVIRGGEWLLTGQGSSVGVPFFPASVWAFVAPYALSTDPLVAVVYVTTINSLMVLGVWWLARRWSPLAGLIAALFIAANPYAVFYARSIWQPNLLAPLMLAWMLTTHRALTTTRTVWLTLSVFIAGIAPQIHFAGTAITLAGVIAFAAFQQWKRPICVLLGGVAAGICALPYLVFLATTPGVLNGLGTSGGLSIDLSAATHAIRLAVGYDWAYLGAGDIDTVSRAVIPALVAAALLGSGLLASARARSPMQRVLWIALAASPLFFLVHTSPVLPHYQLVVLPAAALIAGASVMLFDVRAWRIGVTALMLTAAAVWTTQAVITLHSVTDQRPPNSALSSIVREARDAARGVMQSGDPIIVYTHGDDPLIADGEVTVFAALLWGYPHRIINGDVLAMLPPEPTTVLSTLRPIQAWEALEAAGLTEDVSEFARRAGAPPFVSTTYDGVTEPSGFDPLDPITFSDGTQLYGYHMRRVGARWRVSTLWRVIDDFPPVPYQQFHHLYRAGDDLDAAPFTGADVPLSLHTWHNGDRVIVMADFFDVPPGSYTLAVGHYALGDGTRAATDSGTDRVLIAGIIRD